MFGNLRKKNISKSNVWKFEKKISVHSECLENGEKNLTYQGLFINFFSLTGLREPCTVLVIASDETPVS